MEAKIVLGLGFGDEGKGAVVDNLCKDADNPIVIRFSGGQQCGHGVYISEDESHTHASYGSGSLRGIPTYIAPECTMYLNSIVHEASAFDDEGFDLPTLMIHPAVKVTTPSDVAFGKIREMLLQHGSVGLGVGATMSRHEKSGHKVLAVDFMHEELLRNKLAGVYEYYDSRLIEFVVEGGPKIDKIREEFRKLVIEGERVFFSHVNIWSDYFTIATFDELLGFETLIFEGSQGILLDAEHGVFPNVTYANTTSRNAMQLCSYLKVRPEIYYVTRSYFTRHGNGWMPPGENIDLINAHMEVNTSCPWQGEFKTRKLQPDLVQQAVNIDSIYSGKDKKFLVVTCLDQQEDGVFDVQRDLLDKIDAWIFKKVYTTSSHISKGLEPFN